MITCSQGNSSGVNLLPESGNPFTFMSDTSPVCPRMSASCFRCLFQSKVVFNLCNYACLQYILYKLLLWSEFLCPPKFMYWNPISKVMVLEGGAIGRWFGHEGRALMIGISAHIKEDTIRSQQSVTWNRTFMRTWSCWCHDLGLLAFKLWEINFCCF